jgi:hypothetical protein
MQRALLDAPLASRAPLVVAKTDAEVRRGLGDRQSVGETRSAAQQPAWPHPLGRRADFGLAPPISPFEGPVRTSFLSASRAIVVVGLDVGQV